IQPVMDTITKNAAQICDADDVVIRLIRENLLREVAHYGTIPFEAPDRTLDRRSISGRAVIDGQIVHIQDTHLVPSSEFPESIVGSSNARVLLAVPLLIENQAIGVMNIRRVVPEPFSEKHIALLKTFAAQAAIAIENVRLFNELKTRNLQLTESL